MSVDAGQLTVCCMLHWLNNWFLKLQLASQNPRKRMKAQILGIWAGEGEA